MGRSVSSIFSAGHSARSKLGGIGKPFAAGLILALLLVGMTACAGRTVDTIADSGGASANDPAEPVNRAIFEANQAVDRTVVKPVAEAYRDWVPNEVRVGVHNASGNLKQPATAANDLLQGNPNRAWTATRRFAINTTLGGVGIFDVAANYGLAAHTADFGETLAVWGIGEGPFVELPALGPSNLRDAVGTAVGIAFDPLTAAGGPVVSYLSYAGTGAGFLDARSRHLQDLAELERTSMDYYATLRSVYRQARQADIETARDNASGSPPGVANPPEEAH